MLRADFETSGTLTAVDGVTLTAVEFALANLVKPLPLLGGEARWTDSNGQEHRRMITAHSGSTIRLHFGGPELAPGLFVTVLPNCPQSYAACGERENTDNYGGAIYLPIENPMDGVSMSW
jgi:hypothetical protein